MDQLVVMMLDQHLASFKQAFTKYQTQHTAMLYCMYLNIIACFFLSGFFIPGFPKLKRFQDHHEAILKKFAPKLFKHLVSCITRSFFIPVRFLCLLTVYAL